MMICDLPYLISHISEFLSLKAGDMIVSGSQGGSIMVSEDPNRLRGGEELEFEISEIRVLRNPGVGA